MVTDLRTASHETHVRKITQKAIGPAARCEMLASRLTACVVVLETLLKLQKVDPVYHETIQRVTRQANQVLSQREGI